MSAVATAISEYQPRAEEVPPVMGSQRRFSITIWLLLYLFRVRKSPPRARWWTAYSFRLFRSRPTSVTRTSAAKAEILKDPLAFFIFQHAGLSGNISHFILSKGRLAWKESTAFFTPDSVRIFSAMAFAAVPASGVRQYLIAWARLFASSIL
ncbi:hypothetical protein MPH_02801 [Macrophomina phaseolina MS6]|uniref:Uncharacterized protein n=1 Tax=Macrophomina phaseolina (strain MS6) TaxID=1126212 RepID=K2SBV1_MACPH|nr:hypothetical protein MPH_02801 [Macrophomina phaseolina MS6]